ncbi:MAG: DUF2934 domain-containing protein [Hyphomicrobiales bacterium]
MSAITEDDVRSAAYLIWLDEGCPDGRSEEHWHMAEAMIEKAAKPKRKRAPAKPRKKAG